MPKKRKVADTLPRGALSELLSCFDYGAVPVELPCRDNEIKEILAFIEGNLKVGRGGCMYISGVPGIGKTACVRMVMQRLEDRKDYLPNHVFVELNGMAISEPKRIFVQFYHVLREKGFFDSGKNRASSRISAASAVKKLDRLFELSDDDRPAVVLLMDEIDGLLTRRQQHLYQILEWARQDSAKLTVVAVSNTLDLPERLLTHRNQSRMGLKRLRFGAYKHTEITNILLSRLQSKPEAVEKNAAELVARKVAAVSSDVRRAFEVISEAIRLAISSPDEENDCGQRRPKRRRTQCCGPVNIDHVHEAFKKMANNVKVLAVKHASKHERLLLQAALIEHRRTGLEEMPFSIIWRHYNDICRREEVTGLSMDELLSSMNQLKESGLFTLVSSFNEGWYDFTGRYKLNANPGDIDLAIHKK